MEKCIEEEKTVPGRKQVFKISVSEISKLIPKPAVSLPFFPSGLPTRRNLVLDVDLAKDVPKLSSQGIGKWGSRKAESAKENIKRKEPRKQLHTIVYKSEAHLGAALA